MSIYIQAAAGERGRGEEEGERETGRLPQTVLSWTSGQDGGIGRYILPPRTTKRRTTTNLKTRNNQNCQKVKLYGSPTTKELKKKHSFRLVGGVETGSVGRGGVARWQDRTGRWRLADLAVPHSHGDKLGRTTGEQEKPRNPGFQHGKLQPQKLWK